MIKLNTKKHLRHDLRINVLNSVWDNAVANVNRNVGHYIWDNVTGKVYDDVSDIVTDNVWQNLHNHTKQI